MSTTTLYRFFDAAGRLLYVGISSQPFARLMQHREDKPWWSDIASTKLEHFGDRALALAAELAAIKAENPLHNIAGRSCEGAPPVSSAESTGSEAAPPIGWWCHIALDETGFELLDEPPIPSYPTGDGPTWYGRHAGNFKQGKVVSMLGDLLMVRLYSVWDGSANVVEPFRLDDPTRWRFYDYWDEWVDFGDYLCGFKPGSSRRQIEWEHGPIDGRPGIPKKAKT